MTEEWFGVTDWPQISGRWPPRTDEVAQQVEMKRKQAQEKGAPPLFSENHEQGRNDDGSWPAMEQVMMILLVEMKCVFLPRNSRTDHIGDKAKTINVWQNSREGYQRPVTRIIGCGGGNEPASKKMGDG